MHARAAVVATLGLLAGLTDTAHAQAFPSKRYSKVVRDAGTRAE